MKKITFITVFLAFIVGCSPAAKYSAETPKLFLESSVEMLKSSTSAEDVIKFMMLPTIYERIKSSNPEGFANMLATFDESKRALLMYRFVEMQSIKPEAKKDGEMLYYPASEIASQAVLVFYNGRWYLDGR